MKNTKRKLILSALLTISFLLISEYIFARAGGGGGSGKGSLWLKILLLPFILIYAAIRSQKIKSKKRESLEIIQQAALEDTAWDADKMEAHTKDIFYKMQQAWMDRNMHSVQKLVSHDLFESYTTQLNFMKTNHEKNILEGISITGVSIISSEDYQDNSKDAFVAYITGRMTDYTLQEQTQQIIKNRKKEEEAFSDTYHFIRKGNEWILNHINNDVSLSDISNARNFKEN